jgi:hypothetical protein
MSAAQVFQEKNSLSTCPGMLTEITSEFGGETIRMQRMTVVLYYMVMWKDKMRHFYRPTSAVVWMKVGCMI